MEEEFEDTKGVTRSRNRRMIDIYIQRQKEGQINNQWSSTVS